MLKPGVYEKDVKSEPKSSDSDLIWGKAHTDRFPSVEIGSTISLVLETP